jgi:hypothetical protein
MNEALAEYFLEDALVVFRKYKKVSEDACILSVCGVERLS